MLNCCVFAADYIVTLNSGVNTEGYELKPLIEEAGIYLTDEATAKQLYLDDKAKEIIEDKPVYIPDDEQNEVTTRASSNNVLALSDEYNDTYYSEEVYFSQLKIKDYIDTYKPTGDVRIAVIDTGVNRNHQDFASAKIETGYNYVTMSDDTTDQYGHGTMVTGLIVAAVNDNKGVAGIAPNATIVPLVAMTKIDGTATGKTSNFLLAIKAAVNDYNCKIISTSLGVVEGYGGMDAAVKYAVDNGVIFIAAAGNDGANSDSSIASRYAYPSACDGVLSVGATNKSYSRASYSQKNDRVDVVACGGYFSMPSNTSNTSYRSLNGTSFSTPVIAGATALFVSRHPDITPEQYNYIVKASAMDIGELGGGDYMGYGMPDCMAMEDIFNSTADVFISPVYSNNNTRNIKIATAKDITSALLIASEFNTDGIMTDYTITPLTFDSGFAYVNDDITDNSIKYFVIESLDSLKSLSKAVEYSVES